MAEEQPNHENIGRVVDSRAIGIKPAFRGIIRSAWNFSSPRFGSGTYYHVEDLADGSLWHRDTHDITFVEVDQ